MKTQGRRFPQVCSRLPVVILSIAACAAIFAASAACADEPAKPKAIKTDKIVFLGNSITLHGPLAGSGWTTENCGMAASSPEKDYVHLVTKALTVPNQPAPQTMVQNIADFERQYGTYSVEENLKKFVEFKPSLVILAIGENVSALTSEDSQKQFYESVCKLINLFKKNGDPTVIVRTCFWPDRAKDEALTKAAATTGSILVNIGKLGGDEANYARSERKFTHDGVAGHPGDRGMKAIADAILDAIKKAETPQAK